MYNLEEFLGNLQEFAPLFLSKKMVEKGAYDNSGIIVNNHSNISKIAFSLDLSTLAVEFAIENGCDTIVTHHPAIYNPITNLGVDNSSKALLLAVKNNLNIISFHLNLDITEGGIDDSLATSFKGEIQGVLERIYLEFGYGRKVKIHKQNIDNFVGKLKEELGTDKIICYANNKNENMVENIASFCGAGSTDAVKMVELGLGVDTIITSDIPHHNLLSLIDGDKNVIVIPHYASENYGFKKFYDWALQRTNGRAQAYYFADKRFM